MDQYLILQRESIEKTFEIYDYFLYFPFKRIEDIYPRMIELIQKLNAERIVAFYQSYFAANYPVENFEPEYLRSYMLAIEKSKFESSMNELTQKQETENEIQGFTDFDRNNESNLLTWLKFLKNEIMSKNFERIQYSFEKSLTVKPDCIGIWKLYLNYLDSQYSQNQNETLKEIIQLRINYFFDFWFSFLLI